MFRAKARDGDVAAGTLVKISERRASMPHRADCSFERDGFTRTAKVNEER
jgi:hypothetical protein